MEACVSISELPGYINLRLICFVPPVQLIVIQLSRVVDTESLLMDSSVSPFSAWDVLEHLHMSVIQEHQALPPALFQLCTKSDLSLSQLQIKRAISVIMTVSFIISNKD